MTTLTTYTLIPLSTKSKIKMFAIPVLIVLGLVLSSLFSPYRSSDPAWLMTVAPFLIIVGFGLFLPYRKVLQIRGSTRLELDDMKLRHVTSQRTLLLPWEQIRLLQVQKDEMNLPKTIILRTDNGTTLSLAGFEKMQEIAAFITAQCKSLRASTPFEKAMLSPQLKWLSWVYFIGVFVFMFYVSPDEVELEIGAALLALGYVPYAWFFRGNLAGTASSTGFWKSAAGIFVRNLLIWVAIVIVVLLVLNFMPQKH